MIRTIQSSVFLFLFFGVILSGCDNRKAETSQKNISSTNVSQTQNQADSSPTKEDQEFWKNATDTSRYKNDSGRNDKPLP